MCLRFMKYVVNISNIIIIIIIIIIIPRTHVILPVPVAVRSKA